MRGPRLPRRWMETILPAELPSLTREIVANIREQIPEYRRSMEGPYAKTTRMGVEKALLAFITQFITTGQLAPEHEEVFRALGRQEAQEGRPHDVLQNAYRIGSSTTWKRILEWNDRAALPPDAIGRLASSMFAFMDRLAALSSEGFLEAQLMLRENADRLRARLFQMVLDQPATPMDAIVDLAAQVGWQLPDQVVAIEVRWSGEHISEDGVLDVASIFGPDALVGRVQPPPVVLLPAPLSAETSARLERLPATVRLTIGVPVPLAQARQSLQSAQSAARLRQSGVLPEYAVVHCQDYLPTLMLAANELSARLMAQRRLGPLLALSPQKRLKFGRLLSALLEYGGNQAELAEALEMHRQTVHYQVARLTAMFGDQLRDRDARVEIMLALRAALPGWERAAE